MEYKEGRCPKCNEVMQIPVGREQIICMFCGQEFTVSESRKTDEKAYASDMEQLKGCAGDLFRNVEKTVKGFNRDKYEESFDAYRMEQQDVLQTIRRAMLDAGDRAQATKEIAEVIVEKAEEILNGQKGRIGREGQQMTMNMYMVTYVFPAILSLDNGTFTDLTEQICTSWAVKFKNSNIQAANFASLNSGFRRKLCYITTAVCEGVHKPQDCYELKLLKQYRDGYLAETENGEETIRQYYNMAPTIVKRVGKREDREEIYRFLYETYISPCVRFIEEGKNEECREKYQEMVEILRNEYMN